MDLRVYVCMCLVWICVCVCVGGGGGGGGIPRDYTGQVALATRFQLVGVYLPFLSKMRTLCLTHKTRSTGFIPNV